MNNSNIKLNLFQLNNYILQYDQKSFISVIILGFIGVIIFFESPKFKDINSNKANIYKFGIALAFVGLLINIWIVFYCPIAKYDLEKFIDELTSLYNNNYVDEETENKKLTILLLLDSEKYKFIKLDNYQLEKIKLKKKKYKNIFNIVTLIFQITLIIIFLSTLLILYSRFDILEDKRLLLFLIVIFIVFIILFFITIINNNYLKYN